jgi:topoisomerase-4 subunit A
MTDNIEFPSENNGEPQHAVHVGGMYQNWFLDYASYVILERAVPSLTDGLKPVQRRILHSLWELEDGRYNKVANVIGHCMRYHPHGDASIADAMVQIGQKDLLIDCQGNWGNILTGDSAAAARYIEARLSKFGEEVLFNPKTTDWQLSYDGRNKEPINLPVKFPLLLAQGVEGIAVGLACKIMPHNFIELIDACIDALRNRKFNILPDFATGGQADFSGYNEGLRGGKIRVRARIAQLDKKTLVINEIPFGTTTASLIDSIIAANDKEKIKVRKVEDNTADKVEILIHLAPGVSPDITIDALYKFTDCEVSISPNSCVIEDDKPRFLSVNEILKESAHRTMELLRTELEIRQRELQEAWHFSSLEKIFIEKRIYRNIEECETWEAVLETIAKGLQPYRKLFKRDIIQDDIVKLTEIKIKRISKFDAFKADEEIKGLEAQLKEVGNHIENIVDYSVEYFRNLKKKYGKGKERKTEIRTFDSIVATRVVMANEKLYINRAEGFAGYALKKDEYVCDCSDIDDIVVFRDDGTMTVTRISEKAFVGKGVIHIAVFRKDDERTVYHLVYQDGPRGKVFVKRFTAGGVTRDKAYDLTRGTKGSKILYFTANPNGESEVISVELKPLPNLRKLLFDIDLAGIEIKGRSAVGITVTKFPVKRVIQKSKGFSTLGARSIWFDEIVKRLNADGRGKYLGEFSGEDRIIVLTQSGHYRLYGFDLSTHFEDDLIHIEKFNPERVVSAIYYDGDRKEYFIKRFIPELSEKKTLFITEADGSKLEVATMHQQAQVEIIYTKQKGREIPNEKIKLHEYADVKSLKAKGSRYTGERIKEIMLLSKEQGPAAPEPQKKEAPEPKASKTPKKPDPRALTFEDERKERLKEIRSHLDAMEIQTKLDLE